MAKNVHGANKSAGNKDRKDRGNNQGPAKSDRKGGHAGGQKKGGNNSGAGSGDRNK